MKKADYVQKCADMGIILGGGEKLPEIKQKILDFTSEVKRVNIPSGQVKYIIHTADIHVRYDSRHAEYEAVFDTMINRVIEKIGNATAVTCICGDIIENRKSLDGNMLWLIRNWLKKLGEISNVIIIDGNHDISEGRLERVPLLRSICDGIENVYYIEHSSIVKVGQLSFGVSSLVDRKIVLRENIPEVLNRNCIGVGHFMLSDVGHSGPRAVDKKIFKGYEYMLLGDIHKGSMYDNCMYCGSLIQQNHGEGVSKGFGLIDTSDMSYKFVRVKNKYSFVTLTEGTSFDDLKFTEHIYLRVRSDNNEYVKYVKDFLAGKGVVIFLCIIVSKVEYPSSDRW
jgi:DNA repair exonuclease SbcCD nuclease subunit